MSAPEPSPSKKHLVLVGMMGSGKSSVGRALSARCGAPFLDTDAMIEGRARKTVTFLFREWGEARFREMEREILAEALAEETPSIISTGGGVVVTPENRAALQAHSHVVYLHAPAEVLFQRLKRDTSRPLLQQPDPLQVLRDLEEKRRAFYEEAHDRIDVSQLQQKAAAEEIWKKLPESLKQGLSSGRTCPP